MNISWEFVAIILVLAAALGIATVLKLNVKLFQKHLMPTSMIAGFIGLFSLLLAEKVFKIIDSQQVQSIQTTLGYLVYHLMAIGFIALALKDRNSKRNKDIINTGFFIVNTYMVQAIVGFAVSLILVYTAFPKLFPAFGLFLPLGFAQGPGQALSIGLQWENLKSIDGTNIGIVNGGNIGLSVATIGFLWALIGGVPFMNYLVKKKYKSYRKYNIKEVKHMEFDNNIEKTGTIPKSIYVDDLTIQLLLIGIVYLLAFLFISVVSSILNNLGIFGETVAQMLWGFHFMIGTVIALATRLFLDKLRVKRIVRVNYADNFLLQRISAASFDFMITASITAISIYTLKEYLIPIIILTTVGGLFTMIYTTIMCKWIYKEDVLEHIVALYGMWTGTITTGVALLKEIDPYSKSDVTEHLVLGSGVAIFVGFPLMLILGIPIAGYRLNNPMYYLYTFIALGLFSVVMNILLFYKKKNNID